VNTRRAIIAAASLAAALLAWAHPVLPAVRVQDSEVIFTLRAPEAGEVYLVGDFNQWNPTVERMERIEDRFEIGLFLVAGEYRYKFVVDGTWIVDPDNPGVSAEKGSPLRVVERGGGLLLSTDLAGEESAAPRADLGARYIGALRVEDGDADVGQRVDATVSGRFDRLFARATVATDDSSWSWSPAAVDVFFDRGRVDVRVDHLTATGFENDSTWASSDPTALVGRAGLYAYDAGFRRHGVAGVASGSKIVLRALYADATARSPRGAASVGGEQLEGFVAGGAPDTSLYAFTPTFDASDFLAAEVVATSGGTGLGFVYRRETGVNPGMSARVTRGANDFSATVYATTEARAVSSLWLRHDLFGARITGAYGWGGSDVHASGRGQYSGDLSDGIDAAPATGSADLARPLFDTERVLVELAAGGETPAARLRWDHTRFEGDALAGGSEAVVHRVSADASGAVGDWTLSARALYTDADYGTTPGELTIDGPALNPWLSMWDAYTVPAIVALALERSDVVTLGARRETGAVHGGVEVILETEGVADDLVHASAGADVDWNVRGPWYAYADVRAAWYDRARWGAGGTHASAYLEAGYRRGALSLNAGLGYDPWVFDPVISDYAAVGRSEFLRSVLAGGVRRERAPALVADLIEREGRLEDAGVFKLECVIDLP